LAKEGGKGKGRRVHAGDARVGAEWLEEIRLAGVWGSILLELHRVFGRSATFSIGFVFDDGSSGEETTLAEFEKGEHGEVFYLNPAKIEGKRFKTRYCLSKPLDRCALELAALHELAHALGNSGPDAQFASALTTMAGQLLLASHQGQFARCFAK
jgi:hypothetical protein